MPEKKLLERKPKFPKKLKEKKVIVKKKREFVDPYIWCQTLGGDNPNVVITAEWVDGEIEFTNITVGE